MRSGIWTGPCVAMTLIVLHGSSSAQPATGPGSDSPDNGSSAEQANQRPARAMSLRQVLEVVVQQNPDLARARVDIASAEAGALEASGLDDWTIGASGQVDIARAEAIEGQPFQTTDSNAVNLSADATRPLPSGGTIGLSLGAGYNQSTFAVLDQMGESFDIDSKSLSGSLVASFTHPLLGGRGARIARAAQRSAKVSLDAATLQKQVSAAAAVRDVINAYWELAYAIRAVEIQRGALDLAREQLRITEAAIEAKVVARTEALATRQAIAVREQALLLAIIEVSERSLEVRRLVGLEIGPGEIDIAVTDALRDDGRTIDLDQALRRAEEQNPSLALARINGEITAIELEQATDNLRPRLDFNASIGPTGAASDAGDVVSQMVKLESFTASAGLTYRQTLKHRAARGARDRAQQSSQRVRIDLAEVEREIAVSVVRAVNLVRSARKRIEVGDLAITLAEQNLDIEKQLFEAGTVRSFDVLERQDELSQARLARERAVVDYLEAVATLESLTGDLLTRHEIDLMK